MPSAGELAETGTRTELVARSDIYRRRGIQTGEPVPHDEQVPSTKYRVPSTSFALFCQPY